MNSTEEVIQNCKNSVLNNKQISKADAKTLFQIKDNFLKNLSDAANEITRFYQGKKIDQFHDLKTFELSLNNLKNNHVKRLLIIVVVTISIIIIYFKFIKNS